MVNGGEIIVWLSAAGRQEEYLSPCGTKYPRLALNIGTRYGHSYIITQIQILNAMQSVWIN